MLRFLRFLLVAVVLFVLVGFGFRIVYTVPFEPDRINSLSVPPSESTALGNVVLSLVEKHPGLSAITPLRQGQNAFAARVLLAEAAEASIDARYYIWEDDATGLMLLDALHRAAERGVRVRLLLDDNGTPNLDPELAELGAHPNVEIRIFNPFMLRSPRILSYLLDFRRVNRRMHNKSFTVDGVATIIGGRNVGDIYFAHAVGVNYFDLDVVALGEAAADVAADFDLYWASPSAIPASDVLPPPAPGGGVLAASVTKVRDTEEGRKFAEAVTASQITNRLWKGAAGFFWAEVDLVSDDPAKGQGRVPREDLMIVRLSEIIGKPDKTVDLISAYFVPGDRLTGLLTDWAASGVRVRTLTNAQEATDVLPVHGGYLKYRSDLIDGGVQVYELKSAQDHAEPLDLLDQFGLIGSSKISLHAKAFAIDGDELFVGSFNFDPRSANLNTEMGFLIRNDALARSVYPDFSNQLQQRAYRVQRTSGGGIQWVEATASGQTILHDSEPGTTAFSRALVKVVGWLPVMWLL